MDLVHQGLKRAPADFAKVSVIVRHQLLPAAGTVDVNVRPPQVAIRLTEAAVANECRFRSHARRLVPCGEGPQQKRPEQTG
jgi:hypothetical protein